jgi:hypothetical protein
MFQKIATYVLLVVISISGFSDSIAALEDTSVIHTLDELPYSDDDMTVEMRQNMLDDDNIRQDILNITDAS